MQKHRILITLGALLILILAVIIAAVMGHTNGYQEGYDQGTIDHPNPFDCYEWKGFVCQDKNSQYNCCSVTEQMCSVDYCKGEKAIF